MIIDLGSFAYGSTLRNGAGTPAWGTALGQGSPQYYITREGSEELVMGMVYCSVPLDKVSLPFGKGGKVYNCLEVGSVQISSVFNKVFVNGVHIPYPFIMVLQKEDSISHSGRRGIKYSDKAIYESPDGTIYSNANFVSLIYQKFGLSDDACWLVYDISVKNHEELHLKAIFVNKSESVEYTDSHSRSKEWASLIEEYGDKYDVRYTGNRIPQNTNVPDLPLQQIFYGAPGTGKSHKVKEVTDALPKSDVFRTTFHPDSDYSTFIGCYKPKMVKAPIRDSSGHEITSACEEEKKRIAYEYEPQAFLKAYVRAYETEEPVFLVIEEINRGNCAQIFGDMFQLLDRNENGESDYAIKPETAIQEFLSEKLKDCDIDDETIKSGAEMRLPANLYFWATMNTSDQSLFPIDSAFKRRWDWQYRPIAQGRDCNGNLMEWTIDVNGKKYSWWSFLEKINAQIGEATQSEDKKLGFFFCKAVDGVITPETFVGKVVFYLWNDVFKDYGFEGSIFKDSDNTELSFNKFYQADARGNTVVQKDKVELFLNNLGVVVIKTNDTSIDDPLPEVDEDGNNGTTATKDFSKYSINGSGSYSKGRVVLEAMKIYIANNPHKNADEVKNDWLALGVNVPNFVETQAMFDERKQKSRDPRINEKAKSATLSNGQTLYVSNQYTPERIADLISKINGADWNITISRV